MECIKCGSEIFPGSNFCEQCGAKADYALSGVFEAYYKQDLDAVLENIFRLERPELILESEPGKIDEFKEMLESLLNSENRTHEFFLKFAAALMKLQYARNPILTEKLGLERTSGELKNRYEQKIEAALLANKWLESRNAAELLRVMSVDVEGYRQGIKRIKRKRIRQFAAAGIILAGIIGSIFVVSTLLHAKKMRENDERMWQNAVTANTVLAYDRYLWETSLEYMETAKHAKFREQAKEKRDLLKAECRKKAGEIQCMIAEHKFNDALQILGQAPFKKIVGARDLKDYPTYLGSYREFSELVEGFEVLKSLLGNFSAVEARLLKQVSELRGSGDASSTDQDGNARKIPMETLVDEMNMPGDRMEEKAIYEQLIYLPYNKEFENVIGSLNSHLPRGIKKHFYYVDGSGMLAKGDFAEEKLDSWGNAIVSGYFSEFGRTRYYWLCKGENGEIGEDDYIVIKEGDVIETGKLWQLETKIRSDFNDYFSHAKEIAKKYRDKAVPNVSVLSDIKWGMSSIYTFLENRLSAHPDCQANLSELKDMVYSTRDYIQAKQGLVWGFSTERLKRRLGSIMDAVDRARGRFGIRLAIEGDSISLERY